MKIEKKNRRFSLPVKQVNPNEYIQISGEEKRLGSLSPLLTVAILSIGPFISQTVQALYGMVNLYWVSKGIGDKGIEVFGAIYLIDFIPLAFADYLMSSINIQLSYLFGETRVDECAQVFVDFIRISFFLSLLMPPIILPITKPVVRWFGAGDEISEMCFQYIIPTASCSFFAFLFMAICGLLQSEGHSIIFGVAQSSTLIINMFVFCPIFLLVFKFGIWGASLATGISQFIVSLILVIMIFNGKFTVKPKLNMLFKKFSSETWKALKIGIASLLSYFAASLPEILLQKFLYMSAIHVDKYDETVQAWGVIVKLFQLVCGTDDAIAIGFLPAASYAYGARRYNRILHLLFHSSWIGILIASIYSALLVFFPRQIASIWSKDPSFLDNCQSMIPIVFLLSPLYPIQYTVPALLQGMQRVLLSTILAFLTEMLPLPIFSSILYFTDKNNPARMMWSYALTNIFSFLACCITLIPFIFQLCKEPKDELVRNNQAEFSSVRSIKSDNCYSTPLLQNEADYTKEKE